MGQPQKIPVGSGEKEQSSTTVRQQELREEFRLLDLTRGFTYCDDEESETAFDHPLDVIAAIEENPGLASYIEGIKWLPIDDFADVKKLFDDMAQFRGTSELQKKLDALQKPLWQRIESCEIADIDREKWQQALTKGWSSAVFGVLLTMVPNLRHLRLPGDDHIYTEWLDPIWKHGRLSGKILTKLEQVSVSHNDTEGEEAPELLNELGLVPSLKRFDACIFGSPDMYDVPESNKGLTSKLELIELMNCCFGAEPMKTFLTPLANLRQPDMCNYGGVWLYSYCDTVEEYREKIKECCGPMLEARGMVWKVGVFRRNVKGCCGVDDFDCEEGMMVRCAELAHELEQMDDQVLGDQSNAQTAEKLITREDGTVVVQKTTSFG